MVFLHQEAGELLAWLELVTCPHQLLSPRHPMSQCMSLVLSWAVPPAGKGGALGVIVRTQGAL